jgi:predicted lipid-binding transport protein (Tim44 family)
LNQRFKNRQMPSGNPLANLLVVVVGVLTIAMSVVIGFFAFVALAGFVLIVATVVGIRTWWLRRKFDGAQYKAGSGEEPAAGPKAVIEGEFQVVGSEKPRDSSDPGA